MNGALIAAREGLRDEPPSLAAEYIRHADLVWRSLQRLGVQGPDLEDGLQEVFLIAHRKLTDYDAKRAKFSTWLFGICIRVASTMRRRRFRLSDETAALVDRDTPEAACERHRGVSIVMKALDALSPEHRATFVLFEIEGEDCLAIARLFGVPVGTVYSRLHAARGALRIALLKSQVVEAGGIP